MFSCSEYSVKHHGSIDRSIEWFMFRCAPNVSHKIEYTEFPSSIRLLHFPMCYLFALILNNWITSMHKFKSINTHQCATKFIHFCSTSADNSKFITCSWCSVECLLQCKFLIKIAIIISMRISYYIDGKNCNVCINWKKLIYFRMVVSKVNIN